LPMLKDKNPSPQTRGNKPVPTSIHTKATWASEMPSANQIPPLIKSYQALIPLILCKFHSTYQVTNPKIEVSLITTINH
jgi:hypothetical protein